MKNKSLKNKIIILSAVVAVVTAGGVLAYNLSVQAASKNSAVSTASFEFDASKAPGWWAAENTNPDTSSQNPDTASKMPTARRVIAQGTRDKPTGDCFVMYSYFANSSKNPNEVLTQITAPSDPSTPGAFTLELKKTTDHSMKVANSDVSFPLHQYDKVSPDTTNMSTGEEYAVLKAGTGYIEIRGVCKTVDQLSVTTPVLSAVSFKEN